ncbi:MAG: hypothetical protein CMJ36_01070 [Phycisphaerae bacterium]|nr:hypothetical protein [Phycisphaerae bacterium]
MLNVPGHIISLMAVCLLVTAGCSTPTASIAANDSWTTVAPGLAIESERRMVRIRCWSCLDRGFLEQVLCSPGTREHESLLVTDVSPSSIHAALLLAGHEPGSPGRWRESGTRVELLPPKGDMVSVTVEYEAGDGSGRIREPVSNWIAELKDGGAFPTSTWVFGGSIILEEDEMVGDASNYLADHSGSVIGLVTFGDELLGLPSVIPDAALVQEPEWVVRIEHVPAPGTEVQVILSPVEGAQPASGREEGASSEG